MDMSIVFLQKHPPLTQISFWQVLGFYNFFLTLGGETDKLQLE